MRFVGSFIVASAVGGAFLCLSTSNLSKPIDSKKTNKSCVFCHTKYGSKELTDAGRYYRDKGTLDGYKKK